MPYTHAFWPMPGETLPSIVDDSLTTPVSSQTEDPNRIWVRGSVTSLESNAIVYRPIEDADTPSRIVGEETDDGQRRLSFEYLIYCMGAQLPRPVDVWSGPSTAKETALGGKRHGVGFMQEQCRVIESKQRIVVVGGGALGIRTRALCKLSGSANQATEMASDIKAVHPTKQVTLVHSREQLMPLYPAEFHDTRMSWPTLQDSLRPWDIMALLTI